MRNYRFDERQHKNFEMEGQEAGANVKNKRNTWLKSKLYGKTVRDVQVTKPQSVIDYNNAKKGIDYSDQMPSYYSVLRKGIKWYGTEK